MISIPIAECHTPGPNSDITHSSSNICVVEARGAAISGVYGCKPFGTALDGLVIVVSPNARTATIESSMYSTDCYEDTELGHKCCSDSGCTSLWRQVEIHNGKIVDDVSTNVVEGVEDNRVVKIRSMVYHYPDGTSDKASMRFEDCSVTNPGDCVGCPSSVRQSIRDHYGDSNCVPFNTTRPRVFANAIRLFTAPNLETRTSATQVVDYCTIRKLEWNYAFECKLFSHGDETCNIKYFENTSEFASYNDSLLLHSGDEVAKFGIPRSFHQSSGVLNVCCGYNCKYIPLTFDDSDYCDRPQCDATFCMNSTGYYWCSTSGSFKVVFIIVASVLILMSLGYIMSFCGGSVKVVSVAIAVLIGCCRPKNNCLLVPFAFIYRKLTPAIESMKKSGYELAPTLGTAVLLISLIPLVAACEEPTSGPGVGVLLSSSNVTLCTTNPIGQIDSCEFEMTTRTYGNIQPGSNYKFVVHESSGYKLSNSSIEEHISFMPLETVIGVTSMEYPLVLEYKYSVGDIGCTAVHEHCCAGGCSISCTEDVANNRFTHKYDTCGCWGCKCFRCTESHNCVTAICNPKGNKLSDYGHVYEVVQAEPTLQISVRQGNTTTCGSLKVPSSDSVELGLVKVGVIGGWKYESRLVGLGPEVMVKLSDEGKVVKVVHGKFAEPGNGGNGREAYSS